MNSFWPPLSWPSAMLDMIEISARRNWLRRLVMSQFENPAKAGQAASGTKLEHSVAKLTRLQKLSALSDRLMMETRWYPTLMVAALFAVCIGITKLIG